MSLFSRGKVKSEDVVLIDILSSSIGCAYVRYEEKEGELKPHILYAKRTPVPFQEKINFGRFTSLTLTTLNNALLEFQSKNPKKPKRIVAIIGTPWYASQSRAIVQRKQAPFTFTKRFADDLIRHESEMFERNQRREFWDLAGKSVEFIEHKAIAVALNGYQTRNPIGKDAREVEISTFLSMSPKETIEKMHDVIRRYYHVPLVFHSSLFASFVTLRDTLTENLACLFVDVGGEVTELATIRGNIVEESVSFPFGHHTLIRSLAKDLGSEYHEVDSLLNMFVADSLNESAKRKLIPLLDKLKTTWLQGLHKVLGVLSEKLLLPDKVFVLGNKNVVQWFVQAVQAEDFHQYMFTHTKFDVAALDPRHFEGHYTMVQSGDDDAFLVMEGIFAKNIHTS
jgi:hypothetical protein